MYQKLQVHMLLHTLLEIHFDDFFGIKSFLIPFQMWVLQEWVLNKESAYCLLETWSMRWCLWAQTRWADSDGSVEARESEGAGEDSRSFPHLSHSQASTSWMENLSEMVLVSLADYVFAFIYACTLLYAHLMYLRDKARICLWNNPKSSHWHKVFWSLLTAVAFESSCKAR